MKADDVIGDIKSMLNRLVLVSSSKGYQLDRTPPVAAEDRITDADVDHIEQAIVEKLNELREAALTAGGWQPILSKSTDDGNFSVTISAKTQPADALVSGDTLLRLSKLLTEAADAILLGLPSAPRAQGETT